MSYDRKTAENKIIAACQRLIEAGLIARTWGNVSARLSHDSLLITPSGKGYENMTGSDLVEVSINELATLGSGTPSSEKGIHAITYSLRENVDFIIHTHQSLASSISILPKTHNNSIPCANYGLNASQKLIDNISKVVRNNPASNGFLMSNHGAFCLGKTDEEAFIISKELEEQSRRLYVSLATRHPDFSLHADSFVKPISSAKGLYLLESPFALAISKEGYEVFPYLDDFAQFAGLSMKVFDSLSEITLPQTDSNDLPLRECAILRNKGIVCHASTDDINALSIVVEKQCQAAYLAHILGDINPISPENVMTDRKNYVLSYSKLK